MALTTYTYPSVFNASGDGSAYVGDKTYNGDDGRTYNFSGSTPDLIQLQYHPQTDPYTRPLIVHLQDLDNDLSIELHYFTSVINNYGHLDGKIVTVRTSTGEAISDFTYNGNTYQGEYSIGFDLGENVLPTATTLKYFPSQVDYYWGSYPDPATIGTKADVILPLGEFWWSKNEMLFPIGKITGTVVQSDTIGKYGNYSIDNGIIHSEDDLEALQQGIIDAGDGNNPFPGPITPSDNPFENDHSHTGGGKGKYTKNGDKTGKPSLPSSDVLSSGFIAMYTPTAAQLQALGAKLWSDDFIETFLKLWNDPMEAIISLGLVPFTPTSSGMTNCVIGNYDTEVSMSRVTAQYQKLSCGSVYIPEYWGSALDYSPYCEAEIFLPFVGMKKLDIDDVMDKTLSVDYNVDLLGGEAVCYVTVDDVVMYDFRCNLQTSIPISSSSYASLYSNIIKGLSSLAVGGAAGAATGAAAGAITSAVNVVTSKHSSIERGSELSPNAGVLGLLTPYIILHRVVQSLPGGFGYFKGYPSNITKTLSSCSGYTEVEYIHLDGINATEEEKNDLLTILKEGIII